MGTGGVGKTSLSVAIALRAAQKGKRVAAITVDPSRRLTSLLGLDYETSNSGIVEWDSLSGSLEIFHIDASKVFREFVSSHLGEKLNGNLEKNGIYRQISKNLRETHNFAALYKMVQIFDQDKYDLIILDTPPCNQVIDFFESPGRLQKFFSGHEKGENNSWLSWIQDKGVRIVEKFMQKLVGKEFFNEMESFFLAVGDLKTDIKNVSDSFIKHLSRDDSKLFLVFSPAFDKVDDAAYLVNEITRNHFRVTDFVLNRSHPVQLDQRMELVADQDSREVKLYNYFVGRKQKSKELITTLAQNSGSHMRSYHWIPDLNQKIETPEDILQFASQVEEHWQKFEF